MKNPNGFGTVYKLKGNRRRPWIARVPVGKNPKTGRIKYKPIGYFEDKPSALIALLEYHKSPIPVSRNITLGQLYKEWSETKYKEGITKGTVYNYTASWNYISVYENVPFINLRTSHWQQVINNMLEEGKSWSMQRKVKILIGMLYDYAIDNKITDQNLAKKIKLKKQEKKKREPFTEVEVKTIEKAAEEGVEWADTIMILLYTGARIKEMMLLTKFSIDLNEQLITGGIKTDAGKDRIVPIHPKILPYIIKWYNKNGERLICDENGKAISTRKYREKYYRPTLEKIGVRTLNPHACRHTFASRLSNAGASTKAIQELMGHANYATTANIYTHKNIDELRKAINAL